MFSVQQFRFSVQCCALGLAALLAGWQCEGTTAFMAVLVRRGVPAVTNHCLECSKRLAAQRAADTMFLPQAVFRMEYEV